VPAPARDRVGGCAARDNCGKQAGKNELAQGRGRVRSFDRGHDAQELLFSEWPAWRMPHAGSKDNVGPFLPYCDGAAGAAGTGRHPLGQSET
jgi:hypothetical protein